MKKTLLTAGIALALGVVWTAGPALAQTTGEKAKDKAVEAKDTIKEKAVDAKDTVKEKAVEAKDKIKEKTTELKDKAKAKMNKGEAKAEKMAAKAEHKDVMAMQQALKDKGHDPGPIDGVMGPRTKAALMGYQKKEGLKATGRWDDETATKLGVRMSAADKETVTPSASPATPSAPSAAPTPSTPAGTSTAPPTTPEDKSAPPQKRSSP
jgi:peptidoglycan hydrolase-like protein with peptidoglycan-binding domain